MNQIWREPVRGGFWDPALNALPGIERVQAMYRGLTPLPPLTYLTGVRVTQMGAGSITGSLPASPWLTSFHGWIEPSLVLQPAMTIAVMTTVPPGKTAEPKLLSISYARPATPDTGMLVARARVLHTRRTMALTEATVEDPEGRLLAQGTGVIATPDVPAPTESPLLVPVEEPHYSTPDPYLRKVPEELLIPPSVREQPYLELAKKFLETQFFPSPASYFFGMEATDIAEGRTTITMPASEWFCNPGGRLDDGVIALLMSGALGSANHTTIDPPYTLGVLDLNVKFLRQVEPDGRKLTARARVLHRSDDLLVATAEALDESSNRVAFAVQTGVRLELPSGKKSRPSETELTTVVFTDLAGSTDHAVRLGDKHWTGLLDDHHRVVRKEFANFKGREVKTTGDGFLATFDSPARAVQCLRAVREAVRRLGLEVRAGVHTGEVEWTGGDVGGIAVNIASRVADAAAVGEILVSSTVKDLTAGSGIHFEDRGTHPLKGLPDPWHLYAVAV